MFNVTVMYYRKETRNLNRKSLVVKVGKMWENLSTGVINSITDRPMNPTRLSPSKTEIKVKERNTKEQLLFSSHIIPTNIG